MELEKYIGCSEATRKLIKADLSGFDTANVTRMDSMFEGCANLRTVNLPSGITSIPSKLFRDCSSLETITIPSSVKEISGDAFNGCGSLDNLDIPSSVTEIGGSAFENCPSLMTVIVRSGTPAKIKKDSFSKQFQKEGTLYVPSPSAYRNNPKLPWSNFRNVYSIKKMTEQENEW